MILLQIKAYIRQRHQVGKSDILNRFNLSDDALEGLIGRLIEQGNVLELATDSCSTSCGSGCTSNQTQYLWVSHKIKKLTLPIQVV